MQPEKLAELATQIVIAVIQNGKLDAGNPDIVGNYYDSIFCQIAFTGQKEENRVHNPTYQ